MRRAAAMRASGRGARRRDRAEFNHGKPRAEVIQKLDQKGSQGLVASPIRTTAMKASSSSRRSRSYPWGEGPYGARSIRPGNVAEWTADAWLRTDHDLGYQSLERSSWRSLADGQPAARGLAASEKARGAGWLVARAGVRRARQRPGSVEPDLRPQRAVLAHRVPLRVPALSRCGVVAGSIGRSRRRGRVDVPRR